jgi:hypothetical protein
MKATPPESWSESEEKTIREELDRIVGSGPFLHSRRRQRFLEFIVTEALAGRGDRLKGYNIGLEVFDRPETFDPVIDPLVRIEAARLREKLREYYETDGQSDPIRIELLKGTYTPHIEFRQGGQLRAEPSSSSRRLALPNIGWKQLGMLTATVLLIIAAGLWGGRIRTT